MTSRSKHFDPERFVAMSIARLPGRFGDYGGQDLEVFDVTAGLLFELYETAIRDRRADLDPILPRFERDGQTLREVTTKAERDEITSAMRRYLAVERAQAAWAEYERRSGAPWLVPEVQVTVSEDPAALLEPVRLDD